MPLWSYSRIGCFKTCPRQYKFRYIEKPDIEIPQMAHLHVGTTVHGALERCYQQAVIGKAMSREELIGTYEQLWRETDPGNLKVVKEGMTVEDYYNGGRKALERYHDRYYPFDQEIIMGLERRVDFALDDDGRYRMQGYIDRLTRDSKGTVRIQDYKTNMNLPTQQDADADKQLALYQIAVEKMWPEFEEIELVWHYLHFDTAIVSKRNHKQLENLRKEYIEHIRQIELATEHDNFPTHETNLCDWCDYYDLCPAKGGKGVPPKQPEMPFSDDIDMTTLVDEYIALNEKAKEYDKRLKELKEIFINAVKDSAGGLFEGSAGKGVSVTISVNPKLPSKSANAKAYDALVEILEKAEVLERFSSPDMKLLQEAVTDGKLDDDLLEKVKIYIEPTRQNTVRIKKLKK